MYVTIPPVPLIARAVIIGDGFPRYHSNPSAMLPVSTYPCISRYSNPYDSTHLVVSDAHASFGLAWTDAAAARNLDIWLTPGMETPHDGTTPMLLVSLRELVPAISITGIIRLAWSSGTESSHDTNDVSHVASGATVLPSFLLVTTPQMYVVLAITPAVLRSASTIPGTSLLPGSPQVVIAYQQATIGVPVAERWCYSLPGVLAVITEDSVRS